LKEKKKGDQAVTVTETTTVTLGIHSEVQCQSNNEVKSDMIQIPFQKAKISVHHSKKRYSELMLAKHDRKNTAPAGWSMTGPRNLIRTHPRIQSKRHPRQRKRNPLIRQPNQDQSSFILRALAKKRKKNDQSSRNKKPRTVDAADSISAPTRSKETAPAPDLP
jgi:hypothetical protein